MMSKTAMKFVCQECGTWHGKWSGQCEGCHSWNTLVEEIVTSTKKNSVLSVPLIDTTYIHDEELIYKRFLTNISEFDRACGGGIVPGSAMLIGGDPGIGKSTLLLQVSSALAGQGLNVMYISGEESTQQIKMRAQRLGVREKNLILASSGHLDHILSTLHQKHQESPIHFLIIDSIQTMVLDGIESAAGSVSQIKACTMQLIQLSKQNDIALVLVGHVTKDGTLAGPRVLEHMVDSVLYFEGERSYRYRLLRTIKNRFGPTDEIGIFSMDEVGLQSVENPSLLFLNQSENPLMGSAIFAGVEGTRPILSEIQALVAPSFLPAPRRTAVGFDPNRLSMLLAVLETHGGFKFANKDVYLNVAGGLKISEPAADMAVMAALISAIKKKPLPPRGVFFGEIGLAGELRDVSHRDIRIKEAEKLGFQQAFIPVSSQAGKIERSAIQFHMLKSVQDFGHHLVEQLP